MPCFFSRSRARFRRGHRALDAALDRRERVDEEIDRRARADADDPVFDDVLERRLRDRLLQLVLSHFFFCCGGRSVQTPSKASAAMPTDSLSVGCGWMVLPMSVASAPISTASASSLMRSPAPVPTMPPPTMRWLSASKISLVKPSSRALAMARPEAAHGKFRHADLGAVLLRLVLGQADPGDLRVGVGDRRDDARVEMRFLARRRLGGDVAFVHRLVREHRDSRAMSPMA